MKWKQALADYNLTEETISFGLKNKIKDINGFVSAIDDIKNSINDTSNSEEDIEEYKNDLNDLEKSLQKYDLSLVRAIEIFDKNKDKYADMSKHLGKGRPRINPIIVSKDVTKNTNNVPKSNQIQTSKTEVSNVEVPKKKSSFGFVALAVAIGIISLGAVKMFKNNN